MTIDRLYKIGRSGCSIPVRNDWRITILLNDIDIYFAISQSDGIELLGVIKPSILGETLIEFLLAFLMLFLMS